MDIIVGANKSIFKIMSRFYKPNNNYRLMHYCVQAPVEEGTLLFNLLTREVVLLSPEEFANLFQQDYLKEHWFLVPEDANEKDYVDLIRWVFTSKQNKGNEITSYTIFTTTDCNARCFYCFELGRSRVPMSQETAVSVVEYIKDHCVGKAVKITWFGGEPLMNTNAIQTICKGLKEASIQFTSRMATNGYLFNEQILNSAVENWNLKWVQITLDGTENVYNRIKAYTNKGDSPYQVVMCNIEKLLDASIDVYVRMNMDLNNSEDLLQLMDDLSRRFRGRKGIAVYAHHLFKDNMPMADMHTEDEWNKREAAMCRLEEKIRQCDFHAKRGISRSIKTNHCMADHGKAITIMPDGSIGLCEQSSESDAIGHIDTEDFDDALVESWKERTPAIPECADCFYYPDCIKLRKGVSDNLC